jgi:osmotically-inducible protein OsmY
MTDEPDAYTVEHIRDALARDDRVNELGVQVTMTSAGVFLSGDVATAERRDAITEVVRELLPDVEVHNQTSVAVYPEPPDMEVLS